MTDLAGRVALVTGASHGTGVDIARALAAAGARVAVHYRTDRAAAAALAACESTPDGPVAEAGALERGDATLTSGEFTDRYTVALDEGQWLRVTLASDAFDPYLVVRFPDGQQSDRDDSAEGDTTTVTMAVRAEAGGVSRTLARIDGRSFTAETATSFTGRVLGLFATTGTPTFTAYRYTGTDD